MIVTKLKTQIVTKLKNTHSDSSISEKTLNVFCDEQLESSNLMRCDLAMFNHKCLYFHRIRPLGRFGLVVAMSVCMYLAGQPGILSPSHAFFFKVMKSKVF